MTATTVDGWTVVKDDPAPSPMRTPQGRRIYYRQIRQLTLTNGDEVFGCAHCTYFDRNRANVLRHLRTHKGQAKPAETVVPRETIPPTPEVVPFERPDSIGRAPRYDDLDNVVKRMEQAMRVFRQAERERDSWRKLADRANEDRDRWRARAIEAERILDRLSAALSPADQAKGA